MSFPWCGHGPRAVRPNHPLLPDVRAPSVPRRAGRATRRRRPTRSRVPLDPSPHTPMEKHGQPTPSPHRLDARPSTTPPNAQMATSGATRAALARAWRTVRRSCEPPGPRAAPARLTVPQPSGRRPNTTTTAHATRPTSVRNASTGTTTASTVRTVDTTSSAALITGLPTPPVVAVTAWSQHRAAAVHRAAEHQADASRPGPDACCSAGSPVRRTPPLPRPGRSPTDGVRHRVHHRTCRRSGRGRTGRRGPGGSAWPPASRSSTTARPRPVAGPGRGRAAGSTGSGPDAAPSPKAPSRLVNSVISTAESARARSRRRSGRGQVPPGGVMREVGDTGVPPAGRVVTGAESPIGHADGMPVTS